MPPRVFDEHLDFARKLRREMTRAEAMLWRSLRGRGISAKFRRQVPIGPFVADFACVQAKLIVELDGEPHETDESKIRDRERDAWFAQHGWTVLHYPNDLVLGGGDVVIDGIKAELSGSPHPTSLREATFSRTAGEGVAHNIDGQKS